MTRKELERLQAAGKIRGFTDKNCKKSKENSRSANKVAGKRNKTKEWISKNLWAWAQANKLELLTEHKFHPERKWRFDWAFPSHMIAIEYEGLMSEKSRHTTISGFTGDADKYNAAQQLGWKVFRYTAKNYKSIIDDLNAQMEF
jgi:very-short-patch-repair endonuclease